MHNFSLVWRAMDPLGLCFSRLFSLSRRQYLRKATDENIVIQFYLLRALKHQSKYIIIIKHATTTYVHVFLWCITSHYSSTLGEIPMV